MQLQPNNTRSCNKCLIFWAVYSSRTLSYIGNNKGNQGNINKLEQSARPVHFSARWVYEVLNAMLSSSGF